MRTRPIAILAVALLVAGAAGGCRSRPPGSLGADLSPEVVVKVKRGMTERQVRDILGDPMTVTGLEEKRHMWTYRFVRVADKDGNIGYRGVPLETPDRYHGAVFVIFDAEKVLRVQGGEMPNR